jgi:transcriptional regulator with XRE-family HTH domain
MSQQQVAEASGLDRAYISAVEHGKHNLTMGALLKLADALEIGIEELVIDNAPGMSVNTKV